MWRIFLPVGCVPFIYLSLGFAPPLHRFDRTKVLGTAKRTVRSFRTRRPCGLKLPLPTPHERSSLTREQKTKRGTWNAGGNIPDVQKKIKLSTRLYLECVVQDVAELGHRPCPNCLVTPPLFELGPTPSGTAPY